MPSPVLAIQLKRLSCSNQTSTTYRINYRSIQSITCFRPDREIEVLDVELRPISICYTTGNNAQPEQSYSVTREIFYRHYQEWRKSETWILLKEYLATAAHSSIQSIVCFALGPLTGEAGRDTARSLIQHAAARIIAEALGELFGSEISCYAQDPAYTDVDREVLRSIGIIPLNDPKGFLQVTRNTLVISVNPNVPVKQIVADLERPAAMLWNTVQPETGGNPVWTRKISGDESCWIS
jgi:hypothetical protein